ncbi:MAG: HAMP domain-containing histidine kinase, partial [Cyclobacteriaceae bacterium]|nr:HAMP domain-containing histidine kinase [Cyclobacteriaceae bacterium]
MDLTDEQLLQELKKRFEKNKLMIAEQKDLVDQLEKVNERLLESEKVQSLFLSNIRNEINNPLTSIMGLAAEFRSHFESDPKFLKKAELIFNEAFSLEFQLTNIFVAAELEAGQTNPHVVLVDMDEHVKSILRSYDHLIRKKSMNTVFNNHMVSEGRFKTDAEKLKSIITNLLMNAIEFSPPASTITIDISISEERVLELKITDEGEGIPEESLEVIFDRFVQLDTGSTKMHLGHGVGLAVVKSLLEFMEGSIELSSKLKQGSTFTVHLPEGHTEDELDEFAGSGNEFMFFDED